jgi:hypothetical protein
MSGIADNRIKFEGDCFAEHSACAKKKTAGSYER